MRLPDSENHTNGIPCRLRTSTDTRNAVGANPAITANRTYKGTRDHATKKAFAPCQTPTPSIKKHPSEVVHFEVIGD